MKTLVLDRAYRPVEVVSWQHALTMFFTDKCEIIEEYADEVRSTYLVIKIPAVVRLLRGFRRGKKPVKFSRMNIYARDNYSCQYCGKRKRVNDLTFDHVVPRSRGGKTTWTNIVSACEQCNSWKGGRTPTQAGMTLLKQPVEPKDVPAMMIALSRKTVPDAWRDYLYWTSELDQS